ncbi:unnamed protein product, partial [Rhizoctonia solani]
GRRKPRDVSSKSMPCCKIITPPSSTIEHFSTPYCIDINYKRNVQE